MLCGEFGRLARDTAKNVGDRMPRQPRQCSRILPALAEDILDVADGRTLQLDLHVVPGRCFAVLGRERSADGVTEMVGVVASGAGEVDTADERHVGLRGVPVSDDDELLMVAAEHENPLIEDDLAARFLQSKCQLPILRAGEPQCLDVRPPDHALDDSAAACHAGQGVLDRRVVGQELLGIAAPIGEHDQIALAGLVESGGKGREVRLAVHERSDPVAFRPRFDPGIRVSPFLRAQKPRMLGIELLDLLVQGSAAASEALRQSVDRSP